MRTIFIFLLFISTHLSGQFDTYSYLYAFNPLTFEGQQANFQNANFTVTPRGAYAEIGLYLTLSPGDYESNFTPSELLEFEMYFSLPPDAIVVDSWLWIEDDIIQADIYDRWRGREIYESIVERSEDPSILYMYNRNAYELRVYPMTSDSTRRVKLTYLIPAELKNGRQHVQLPMHIIQGSETPLEEISVQFFHDDLSIIPQFEFNKNINFTASTHQSLGTHYEAAISVGDSQVELSYDPFKNQDILFHHFKEGGENFYQMILNPSSLLGIQPKERKVAVLVDYDATDEVLEKRDILNAVRSGLVNQLNDEDLFNLFLANENEGELDIKPLAPIWLPATDSSIELLWETQDLSSSASSSHMKDLLFTGIDFIKELGTGGEILLITNNSEFFDRDKADILISDLKFHIGESEIPIHVSDFQTVINDIDYNRLTNTYYLGNERLYENINQQFGGKSFSLLDIGDFQNTVSQSISNISGLNGIIDIDSGLKNGFTYEEFQVGLYQNVDLTQSIIETGKYEGQLPFNLEINAKVDDQLYNRSISVDENDVTEEVLGYTKNIWVGNYIKHLESELTNQSVSEIIEISLANRVLSLFTTFLALEPAQGGVVCHLCIDETNKESVINNETSSFVTPLDTILFIPFETIAGRAGDIPVIEVNTTATDDLRLKQISISASPNPFYQSTQISFGSEDKRYVKIKIFDMMGQLLREVDHDTYSDASGFVWDGTSQNGTPVKQGIYIVMIQTESSQNSMKIVYLE